MRVDQSLRFGPLHQTVYAMADRKTFYHCTTKENADAILKSGVIKPSVDGAYGGNKVYLTSMDPSAGKEALARNNYDGLATNWESREKAGSVDVCIKVDLPASQVKRATVSRDVYTYDGPLKLHGGKKK